jgi:hypothetical protein
MANGEQIITALHYKAEETAYKLYNSRQPFLHRDLALRYCGILRLPLRYSPERLNKVQEGRTQHIIMAK